MKYTIAVMITLFALLKPALLFSQAGAPLRMEINAKLDSRIFNIVPCRDHGVLMFYESVNKFDESHTTWVFTQFDTELRELRTFEVYLLTDALFRKYVLTDSAAYMIFLNTGNIKEGVNNLDLVKFSFDESEFSFVEGNVPEKAELVDVEAMNDRMFACFDLKKSEVLAIMADFKTKNIFPLAIDLEGKTGVKDIYIDPFENLIKLIVNNYPSKKENRLAIQSFTPEGIPGEIFFIVPTREETELSSARMIAVNKQNKLIIGTYNSTPGKSKDLASPEETIAAGLFTAGVKNSTTEFTRYYNFIEFKNFFSYVNVPEVIKVKKKAKKKTDKEYSLNYRLLLHDIFSNGGQYYLLAEAYYPEYRTVTYITYDYYGRPFPQTYTVFDGFKFFSGIISGFNLQGELLWDNGIKIWNIQSFIIEKHVTVFFDMNYLVLSYNSEGKIASEIYSNGTIAGDFEYNDLDTKYAKDRIMADEGSNMVRWYDNYFLCYGYQEIKNNSLRDSNKRSVFYINKVAFD